MVISTFPRRKSPSVVTDFIMTAPPPRRPAPASIQLFPESVQQTQPEPYGALFRRIGAPWPWFSRLKMTDETLPVLIGTGARRWLMNRTFPTSSRRKPHRADQHRPPPRPVLTWGLLGGCTVLSWMHQAACLLTQ
jgi:hypothetical protein